MVIRDWRRARLVLYTRPEEYLKPRGSNDNKLVGNPK